MPMPDKCRKCEKERNCVNGGYCLLLKKSIEYLKEPICNESKDTENRDGHHL